MVYIQIVFLFNFQVSYEFPNGYNSEFGIERFKIAEALFDPNRIRVPNANTMLSAAHVVTTSVGECQLPLSLRSYIKGYEKNPDIQNLEKYRIEISNQIRIRYSQVNLQKLIYNFDLIDEVNLENKLEIILNPDKLEFQVKRREKNLKKSEIRKV